MNYDMQEEDDREISLGNMFSCILRKWNIILICAVIAAVIAGTVMSVRQAQSNAVYYGDDTLAALRENLTQTQINSVDQLYQRYTAYQKKSEENQDYLSRSILMNLDPNNISIEKIEYLVDSDQADAVSSFADFSLGQEDYQAIADAISTDSYKADPKYAYELVTIDDAKGSVAIARTNARSSSPGLVTGADKTADEVNVASEGDGLLSSGGSLSNGYRELMEVTITASSKDQSDAIAAIVKSAIQNRADQLKASGVDVSLQQTGSNYTESVDRDLADQQQSAIMEGSDLINEYNTFRKNNIDSLEEDEKNYFDYLVASRDKKVPSIHWKRYTAIGGLIGLAAALVIIIIAYLASKKFHTPDDVELACRIQNQGSPIPTLGVYHHMRKHHVFLGKLFNSWANHIDYSGLPDAGLGDVERTGLVTGRVLSLCAKQNISSLYLLENFTTGYGSEVCSEIAGKLSGSQLPAAPLNADDGGRKITADNIKVKHIVSIDTGNPLRDPDDLKDVERSEAVLLLQGINDVRQSSLASLLQICTENDLPVVGVVIIAETD